MTASAETWHHGLIAAACEVYKRCRYLEIGVARGDCLRAVEPHAHVAVGVDPRDPIVPVEPAAFVRATSDEFFASADESFDVIFVDGDHSLDQASRDFWHAVAALTPGGVIFLHDVHPLSEVDTRERIACGEVWRLAVELRTKWARDFETFTWSRFPGLMQIRRRGDAIDASSVVAT